ncbi:MAG: ABC transporter permease [Oscillospiraceae bacterium]|nr:ABC transporter permease [Oscillospiraceae bacterium]
MTGPIFISVLTILIGIYFMSNNMYEGYPFFSYSLYGGLFTFLLIIPILTMRSFAEDRHSKADQLLMTAPISSTGIVLGKFFAMVSVFLIPCVIFATCPIIIYFNGNSYPRVDHATLFAFFMLGCLYISIGMFISSLTESQIISAVATFTILLVLYYWDTLMKFVPSETKGSFRGLVFIAALLSWLIYFLSNNWKLGTGFFISLFLLLFIPYKINSAMFYYLLPDILSKLSLTTSFENFAYNQMFDLKGIFTYLSLTFLMVFLTIQAISRRRWN